jgi:hypothetical protein
MLMDMTRGGKKTHSTSENRNPIQLEARGPPMNVTQILGIEEEAFGIFAQRTGLEKKNWSDKKLKNELRTKQTSS